MTTLNEFAKDVEEKIKDLKNAKVYIQDTIYDDKLDGRIVRDCEYKPMLIGFSGSDDSTVESVFRFVLLFRKNQGKNQGDGPFHPVIFFSGMGNAPKGNITDDQKHDIEICGRAISLQIDDVTDRIKAIERYLQHKYNGNKDIDKEYCYFTTLCDIKRDGFKDNKISKDNKNLKKLNDLLNGILFSGSKWGF